VGERQLARGSDGEAAEAHGGSGGTGSMMGEGDERGAPRQPVELRTCGMGHK
jgi:hypothetical protein